MVVWLVVWKVDMKAENWVAWKVEMWVAMKVAMSAEWMADR